jgi:hypothetical protein
LYLVEKIVNLLLQWGCFQTRQSSQCGKVIADGDAGWEKGPFWQKANAGWGKPSQFQLPIVGKDKTHHEPQKSGLSGSVGSQEAEYGTIRDL